MSIVEKAGANVLKASFPKKDKKKKKVRDEMLGTSKQEVQPALEQSQEEQHHVDEAESSRHPNDDDSIHSRF